MANASHGCGMGCLAVWVVLGTLWLLLGLAESGYARWCDVRPFLAKVRPGMTEAEVLARAPKRFDVSTYEGDWFFVGASVVDVDARPAKRMCFTVNPETFITEILGFLAGIADVATVYFDADGRVVGEGYSAYSGAAVRSWRAKRPWGVEYGGRPVRDGE